MGGPPWVEIDDGIGNQQEYYDLRDLTSKDKELIGLYNV